MKIRGELLPRMRMKLAVLALMAAISGLTTRAEIVTIASRPPGGELTASPCPPYCEFTGNWANSTLKSSAPGLPTTRGGVALLHNGHTGV